jgi:hypothetical protein
MPAFFPLKQGALAGMRQENIIYLAFMERKKRIFGSFLTI